MANYPICLAAYSTNEDRIRSSSGGIFAEMAKKTLENNGVVFGASIDITGRVFHKYVTQKHELKDLFGSKYVQSDIGNSYIEVKRFLNENRLVLFCGTPCQCEGLLSFLKNKPYNLILIDFICHGVPSFKVFSKYLCEISDGQAVEEISFRDKEHGWLDYSFKVCFKNGMQYKAIFREDNYMKGFVYNFYLRPSCYNCSFKGINRNTDITMGDFWGIKNEEPEFYDKDGVSVLLLHNEKAIKLIGDVKDKIVSKEIDVQEITRNNPSLIEASQKSIMRDLFFFDMRRGVNHAIEGILNPNKLQKVRNKVYRSVHKSKTAVVSGKSRAFGKIPELYENKENCCGCRACANACPKDAITMDEDIEGFAYPRIDKDLCVGCNSCVNACPI
jgi:ferredoxin